METVIACGVIGIGVVAFLAAISCLLDELLS